MCCEPSAPRSTHPVVLFGRIGSRTRYQVRPCRSFELASRTTRFGVESSVRVERCVTTGAVDDGRARTVARRMTCDQRQTRGLARSVVGCVLVAVAAAGTAYRNSDLGAVKTCVPGLRAATTTTCGPTLERVGAQVRVAPVGEVASDAPCGKPRAVIVVLSLAASRMVSVDPTATTKLLPFAGVGAIHRSESSGAREASAARDDAAAPVTPTAARAAATPTMAPTLCCTTGLPTTRGRGGSRRRPTRAVRCCLA